MIADLHACYLFPRENPSPFTVLTPEEEGDEELHMKEPPTKRQRLIPDKRGNDINQLWRKVNQLDAHNKKQADKIQQQAAEMEQMRNSIQHLSDEVKQLRTIFESNPVV